MKCFVILEVRRPGRCMADLQRIAHPCFSTCFNVLKLRNPPNWFAVAAHFVVDLRMYCENRGSERLLCKQEVTGSIPVGSILLSGCASCSYPAACYLRPFSGPMFVNMIRCGSPLSLFSEYDLAPERHRVIRRRPHFWPWTPTVTLAAHPDG